MDPQTGYLEAVASVFEAGWWTFVIVARCFVRKFGLISSRVRWTLLGFVLVPVFTKRILDCKLEPYCVISHDRTFYENLYDPCHVKSLRIRTPTN